MFPFAVLLNLFACTGETPKPAAPPPAPPVVEAPAAPPPPAAPPAEVVVGTRINVNSASAEELGKVPGATPKMVHEFEEYRPYVSVLQFRKEMGKYVDAATIAAYETHLFVPIDPEASDSTTLQQIKGLDAAEADGLVAGRPFGSREAFLAKLTPLVSAPELEAAKRLLVP